MLFIYNSSYKTSEVVVYHLKKLTAESTAYLVTFCTYRLRNMNWLWVCAWILMNRWRVVLAGLAVYSSESFPLGLQETKRGFFSWKTGELHILNKGPSPEEPSECRCACVNEQGWSTLDLHWCIAYNDLDRAWHLCWRTVRLSWFHYMITVLIWRVEVLTFGLLSLLYSFDITQQEREGESQIYHR